jgi:hypothetical protein
MIFEDFFTLSKFDEIMKLGYPTILIPDRRKRFYNVLLAVAYDKAMYSKMVNNIEVLPRKTSENILSHYPDSVDDIANLFLDWHKKGWQSFTAIVQSMQKIVLNKLPILWEIPKNIYNDFAYEIYVDLQTENEYENILADCFFIAIYNDWFVNFCVKKDDAFISCIETGIEEFKNTDISIDTCEIFQILLKRKDSSLNLALHNCFPQTNMATVIYELCEKNTEAKIKSGMGKYNDEKAEKIKSLVNLKYNDESFFTYALFEYQRSNIINRKIAPLILQYDKAGLENLKKEILNPGSVVF